MVAVIVAAHGHLAEGLIASSAMIAGPQEDLVAVTFDPSEGPDDLLAKYAAAVEKSASDRYLILVDLLGGSPYKFSSSKSVSFSSVFTVLSSFSVLV